MKEFNVYNWLDDLENEIIDRIKNKEIETADEMRDFINYELDNECMYYSDCLGIIDALGAYDFSRFEFECTNISQVAYCALLEETYNLDFDELKNKIDD